MPMIIRNNIRYTGGSGSGGNTNSVELTQAEYDELLEAGQVNQTIAYFITDSEEPNIVNDLVNIIYPIGSIYMSVNNVSPSILFGGTWEQIKDTFLLSAGDTYSGGSTGGEASHTLTVNEIPNHSHSIEGAGNVYIASGGEGMWINRPEASTGYATWTSYVGGSQAHNNMPPYLTVFVWKRVS